MVNYFAEHMLIIHNTFRYALFLYQVALKSSVDVWLSDLLKNINESLYSDIQNCMNDIDASQSIEEWAGKVEHCKIMICLIHPL